MSNSLIFGNKGPDSSDPASQARLLKAAVTDLCEKLQSANDLVLGHKKGSNFGYGPDSKGPSA